MIDVDGFQVATALDEDLLEVIADVTGGTYHPAATPRLDAITDSLDLRAPPGRRADRDHRPCFASPPSPCCSLGGVLMLRWFGRIV